MNFRFVLLLVCLFAMSIGCGEMPSGGDSAGRPDIVSNSPTADAPAARPIEPPTPTNELTKTFFGKIVRKELGDKTGKIELRDVSGILIHPGETTQTSATFLLGGEYKELQLRLFMAPLGKDGEAIPDAGTVNVEIILDGKSVLKHYVDRNTSVQRSIDVANARELAIRVNNANGKAWFDWFFVSVETAV